METYINVEILDGTPAQKVFACLLDRTTLSKPIIALVDNSDITLHLPANSLSKGIKTIKSTLDDIANCKLSMLKINYETNEKVIIDLDFR